MTPVESFINDLQSESLDVALRKLGDNFIAQKRFHELFELRKIQLRRQLGLPVEHWQSIDDVPGEKGLALERGLLEICREVGGHLMRTNDLAGGWSYLEPVGDKALVREILHGIEPGEENLETLIHISLTGGIDPMRGFQLVLDRFGTCSAITTLETRLADTDTVTARGPVSLLVRHVWNELLENIRRTVRESGESAGDDLNPGALRRITESHPWLTEDLNHQIDTTHLASTVKYAKILDDPGTIDMAIDLAEYGSKLHEDFQYPGRPPFPEMYRDTLQYLQALKGQGLEETLTRLAPLARQLREQSGNLDAAAWYICLLDRAGRGEQAIQAWMELMHQPDPQWVLNDDVAPSLQQLVHRYQGYDLVETALQQRGDLLGLATVVAVREQDRSPGDLDS